MKKLLIALFFIASANTLQAMKTEAQERLERFEKVKQAREAQREEERAIVASYDLTQDHMRLDVLERVKAALEKVDQDSKTAEASSIDQDYFSAENLEKVLAALQQAGTREE
jgi:hypothetical protein